MKMMTENILSLVVPVVKGLREEIRQKTDGYFVTNVTIPPVSYNKLADFADDLIAENDWDKSYKAFVMVCCGNAVWRKVVGAIPYERRMLLLPQCLKNSNMCKAQEDELGLLCNECGNCNISGFIQEAEKLGYITIVAEGTTIASRLVESGKVDAIVGVGCMEVLQKIFKAVNKYSVPAIGVPLLSCGCIDTKADAEWIMEELKHLDNKGNIHLLNLNDLKGKTASLFTVNRIDQLLNLSQNPTDDIIRELMLAGGKRIRPLLTALTYEAFSNKPDIEVLSHLAMSIECFHKASLVHDDIEDGDEQRYGKDTTHTKYGIPVAINAGDLLIGEGYRLIAECGLSSDVITECLKIVSAGHKSMSLGQGNELMARRNNSIPSIGEIIDIFKNKTGEAFRVSLLTGAVVGGAGDEALKLLDNFSYLIGIAYQLKDDLEDINDAGEGSVLKNPSAVISSLTRKAANNENELIRKAVQNNEIATLRELITKYSVADHIDEMILEYLRKIDDCLGGLENIPLKLALYEIVGKTFSKYL
jgi:geranylgeranyl pyrophosphate synthase